MRRGRDVACASPSGPLRAQREAVRPRRSSSGGLALARGGAFAIKDYLDMEQRWLALARSYEFAERLSRFTAPFSKGKKPKNSRRTYAPQQRHRYSITWSARASSAAERPCRAYQLRLHSRQEIDVGQFLDRKRRVIPIRGGAG